MSRSEIFVDLNKWMTQAVAMKLIMKECSCNNKTVNECDNAKLCKIIIAYDIYDKPIGIYKIGLHFGVFFDG